MDFGLRLSGLATARVEAGSIDLRSRDANATGFRLSAYSLSVCLSVCPSSLPCLSVGVGTHCKAGGNHSSTCQ